MKIYKTVYENGDVEIDEYYDVNDDELIELVQNYPNLLDNNNNIYTRYHQLFQLDGVIMNDIATDDITMC